MNQHTKENLLMSEEIKIESKNKINKKLLISTAVFIAVALVALLVVFAPKAADAKKIQEQLSLGQKYLSELNYEQAEAAYLAVLAIDPKNVDAYLGLADVYVAQGEYDKAIDVLEDALDNLSGDAAIIIEEKLEEVRVEKAKAEVIPIPVPTEVPVSTVTTTPTPTNTPTSESTEISATPVPTTISIPESTNTSRIEEEFWFETETVEDRLIVDAENLKVIVEDGKTATIIISGIEVQDSYVTNFATSSVGQSEYRWGVTIYSDAGVYSVQTDAWVFAPGEIASTDIKKMDHAVYQVEDSNGHYLDFAEMSYTTDSITWTFAVKEEYSLDFTDVTSYVVDVYRADNQKYVTRKYSSKTSTPSVTETPI